MYLLYFVYDILNKQRKNFKYTSKNFKISILSYINKLSNFKNELTTIENIINNNGFTFKTLKHSKWKNFFQTSKGSGE